MSSPVSSPAGSSAGDPEWVRRTTHVLRPDPARVASGVFLPGQEMAASAESRSTAVLERILALSTAEVDAELGSLAVLFAHRHRNLEATWEATFELVRHRVVGASGLTPARRRLVGACFTQEYALEGAALTNPSMVPHPDQSGLDPGATRFVMTVRAVGEGHVSSVELRTGTVDEADVVVLDPPPTVAVCPEVRPTTYSRAAFAHQLDDLGGDRADADFVLAALPPRFGRTELDVALSALADQRLTRGSASTAERLEQIAAASYAVEFPVGSAFGERVLMPRAPSESHGLEDVRMVLLADADDGPEYVGTYTAYDGRDVSGQLLRTRDFTRLTASQLSGPGSRNKGLAVFPRRIDGRYVAMSRADRENNAVATSTDLLHWDEPVRVEAPRRAWEVVELGNCGSPIETEEGWLVLTHGVGPMRRYSIGALLLDRDDPTVVRGRLERPFLTPAADERSGYVPNVVYSCGAMLHGRTLVLPYGCSDWFTRIALVDLDALLAEMRHPSPGRRA